MASKFFKAGAKVFEYLKPKPTVNKTKLDKAKSDLNIAIQKTKGSKAKLKQTLFEIENKMPLTFKKKSGKSESNKEAYKRIQKDNTKVIGKMFKKAIEGKKDGGRMGLKRGTGLMQKKSNVQKIKETFGPKNKSTKFGMLSVKAGIDKNPNPTQADRIAGAKMKSKKRFV